MTVTWPHCTLTWATLGSIAAVGLTVLIGGGAVALSLPAAFACQEIEIWL